MSGPLSEGEVTLDRVEAICKAALLNTERDSAGRCYVVDAGVNVRFTLDTERTTLSMQSAWPFKSTVPEADKQAFVSRLNNEFLIGRFAMPDASGLLCDHHIMYNGGLNPAQLVGTVKYFLLACHHVLTEDSANMLGTE